jgi:hypothetical protein
MERLTTISINLRFLWDLTKIKKKKSFGNFAHEPQEDDKNANFHRLLFAKFQKCVNYIMTNQGKCNTFFCQTYTSAKFFECCSLYHKKNPKKRVLYHQSKPNRHKKIIFFKPTVESFSYTRKINLVQRKTEKSILAEYFHSTHFFPREIVFLFHTFETFPP